MQLPVPMLKGRLLKRYKRFLSDIELENGEVVTAHCPNSGSMKNLIEDNPTVFISRSDNPKRKLAYTLELIESKNETAAAYSAKANTITVEAIENGVITELQGYDAIRTEVPYGTGSRIDILLETGEEKCYVEVKSVTLLENDTLMFPDSVTTRGQKHLRELMQVKAKGDRAVIFFAVLHTGGTHFSPADHIDPVYGRLLRQAKEAGVEVLAYQALVTTESISLEKAIPITL